MYYVYQLQLFTDDHYRIMLRAAAGSDYINASFIDVRLVVIASCNGYNKLLSKVIIEDRYLQGYRQHGAYIATQAPMENTVNDFWRMIWDYQSRSIVILCKMKEDGKANS